MGRLRGALEESQSTELKKVWTISQALGNIAFGFPFSIILFEIQFPETWNVDKDRDLKMDMAEQFCQDVVVSRFVSEVIGRSLARAEAEEAVEAVIETKNQEISRLRDKLQYYETVNHEMSQRNQEVLEIARRQRELRKRKQRWIWSGIGFTMAVEASVLAYSYLPSTSRHESASSSSDLSYVPPDNTESA
ncbi:hypothetical protein GIB67_033893 [Kingdonia uniflora]|uniref:Uncharacterized protein n=1 Tax=Kingdonia uniflora TaxID=39325 RepID=A0A7J7NC04_9MAGN|nr:hypothetical protein GIB67_033893 [Kingdonia uniflora]